MSAKDVCAKLDDEVVFVGDIAQKDWSIVLKDILWIIPARPRIEYQICSVFGVFSQRFCLQIYL